MINCRFLTTETNSKTLYISWFLPPHQKLFLVTVQIFVYKSLFTMKKKSQNLSHFENESTFRKKTHFENESSCPCPPVPMALSPFLMRHWKFSKRYVRGWERKFIQVKALDIKLFLKKDFGTKQVPIKKQCRVHLKSLLLCKFECI